MNFLSIEYFLVILEEGSFSAAARRLLVSQQSLSEHLKKLEDEIGASLLKRGRPITLTTVGEVFARGAQQMLSVRDDMLRNIASINEKEQQKITIAISTSEAPPFLPGLLSEFSARYPNYKSSIMKRQPFDIAYNMEGIDLYFSFLPLDENLEHVMLIEDDSYAVVAHKSLFEKTFGPCWPSIEQELLKTGNLTLLRELPFIILRDRQGNNSRDLDQIFTGAGFEPIVAFHSESGDLNTSMCVRSFGAYIGPMDLCRRKFRDHLAGGDNSLNMYKIQTEMENVCLALSHKKGKKLSTIENKFIETTREYIASHDI